VRLTRRPASDWGPNWGPSGDIAFQSNRDGNWEIYAVDARGGPQTNLTNSGAEDTDSSWSPDSSRIVFSSDRGDFVEAEIFVLDAGGSGAPPVRVRSDPAYDGAPSWSPDGTIIVFESDRSGNLDIWTIPASA
jgi:TolB protein